LNNTWDGVATTTLKTIVNVSPSARYVLVHALGGYTTNLTVEDLFQLDVLLATAHDGEPLSTEHGGPVRLVVPRLYFWKSAKWITGLQFLADDHPGYWETFGYHNRGDPWREERYSR
jgi:DMSO/TMAO reductase YedYZ molybdopterin-dependent catalytic subunit